MAVRDVRVHRPGDERGNWMVLELTTGSGRTVKAVGVPRPDSGPTGPTFVYLVEEEGLTLIDSGCQGTFHDLREGLALLRYEPRDVERVVVTHGHSDHDGGVLDLVDVAGAELWAHAYWVRTQQAASWRPDWESNPFMARYVQDGQTGTGGQLQSGWYQRQQAYHNARRQLKASRLVRDGDRLGDMHFMYTPGHSPDELCIGLDGVVFTGDHVLPEITPHPTILPASVETGAHGLEAHRYGLGTYLRSLKRVLRLPPETTVLPAHRLYSKGRLHLKPVDRAKHIMDHHARRLAHIIRRLGRKPTEVERLTRTLFPHILFEGGNRYLSVSEVLSHLEFLVQTGDVELLPDGRARWLGTERFYQVIAGMDTEVSAELPQSQA